MIGNPNAFQAVRTAPYVHHNSDSELTLTAGSTITIALSPDFNNACNVDSDNGPTGWPGAAIEIKWANAYMMDLNVGFGFAFPGEVVVRLSGAPHGQTSGLIIAGEWIVPAGRQLAVARYPLPHEFMLLEITNYGLTLAAGGFWEYHLRG